MKPIGYLFISVLGMLVFTHCHVKNNTAKGYETILFGSGGGFTGMVKSYRLDSKGILVSEKDNQTIRTVSSRKFKEINKKLDEAGALDISFNQPGNFYYFLEVSKNGKTNRITWSDQNKAPAPIVNIYKDLSAFTNSEK